MSLLAFTTPTDASATCTALVSLSAAATACARAAALGAGATEEEPPLRDPLMSPGLLLADGATAATGCTSCRTSDAAALVEFIDVGTMPEAASAVRSGLCVLAVTLGMAATTAAASATPVLPAPVLTVNGTVTATPAAAACSTARRREPAGAVVLTWNAPLVFSCDALKFRDEASPLV